MDKKWYNKNMEKYMIAIDLDGTLLPDLYSLSEYSIKVFRRLNELGHKVIITTGRPLRSSFFVYDAFKLDTPIINYNGCLISNPSQNHKVLLSKEMNIKSVMKLYNDLKGSYTLFFCESYDDIYSNIESDEVKLLMHYNDKANLYVGDLNKILKVNPHGSLILATDDGVDKMMKYIKENLTDIGARVWKWGPYKNIIELYTLSFDKGQAIRYVREQLGFKKENTIACGDSQNDFEFFSEAGIKVSLKNADESIKKISDYVYDEDCANSGLAKFFNDFFDLKIEE